jgi:hypothetical protein
MLDLDSQAAVGFVGTNRLQAGRVVSQLSLLTKTDTFKDLHNSA